MGIWRDDIRTEEDLDASLRRGLKDVRLSLDVRTEVLCCALMVCS